MHHRAVFVLSTGRCGTQWIARHLGEVYGDLVTVAHEPLHDGYRSRDLLGRADLAGAPSEAIVREHIEHIERVLEQRTYVEAGWPAWGALPILARHFAGRFAVVHLTRHPVPVACSWVTHGTYRPPMLPGIHPEKIPVTPFDDGVAFPEYRELWDSLDPFQRCVYFWAEVNRLGLRMEAEGDVPWLRVRYDDLFTDATLASLVAFVGLPDRAAFAAARGERVDRFEFLTEIWWDVTSPARLPRVAGLAEQLGHDLADVDDAMLRRRYLAG